MEEKLEIDREIYLNGYLYRVAHHRTQYGRYYLSISGYSNNAKIFDDLLMDESDISELAFNLFGYKAYGVFPELKTLEDLQKIVDVIREIISIGSYKSYIREHKLKEVKLLYKKK